MIKNVRMLSMTEASEVTGLDRSTVIAFIQQEWIFPTSEDELDPEDIARIHLIQELRGNMGVNDEAIPLILHLIDQLYSIRNLLKKHSEKNG